jgi:hypothetical protein
VQVVLVELDAVVLETNCALRVMMPAEYAVFLRNPDYTLYCRKGSDLFAVDPGCITDKIDFRESLLFSNNDVFLELDILEVG